MARHDRGQATVEFALGLPVVVLFLLLVLQVALVGHDRVLLAHATREAARAAAIAPEDRARSPEEAAQDASAGLTAARLDVSVHDGGTTSTVTVTYRSVTDLPLIGPLLPDPMLTERVVVATEAATP